MILVCISTWRDAGLLRGALESVVMAGLFAQCLDGKYETYAPEIRDWTTPEAELDEASRDLFGAVAMTRALRSRPWASEAEKKSALVTAALAHGPDWLLFLDADERLESGTGALREYVAGLGSGILWANVNLYQPAAGVKDGYPIPRLVRALPGLHFRPPRDFELWDGDMRIAYLDGEEAPILARSCAASVPPSVLRIRHERQLRPEARLEQSGRYVRERRRLHGVP